MSTKFKEQLEKSGLNVQEASEKLGVTAKSVYRYSNGECRVPPLAMQKIRELADLANKPSPKKAEFKYIDLFAGIGGFRKAFDSIGGQCVFTSEWDKYSKMTYQANYVCDHDVVGDIREFTKDEESLDLIPKHEVLVAGFPCQPFSIAGVSKKNSLGKSHGFKCDTQGTLFFDLAQIIEYHQPDMFLLENVKNLKSHDKGKTFEIIMRTLEEELQYDVQTRIIDARHWVPQHRERIFIVGTKRKLGFDFKKFNIPNENPILESILHNINEEEEVPFFINGEVNSKYTLSPKLWDYLVQYKEKHRAKGNGFGFSVVGPGDVSRTLSARYYKDGSEILVDQVDKRPRRLTPRECSRLMGFDGYGESNFNIPVSDTQAYRQFGNSVAVPVATAIAEYMKPYIMEMVRTPKNQLSIALEEPMVKYG